LSRHDGEHVIIFAYSTYILQWHLEYNIDSGVFRFLSWGGLYLFSSPVFEARRLKLGLRKMLPIIYSPCGGLIPLIPPTPVNTKLNIYNIDTGRLIWGIFICAVVGPMGNNNKNKENIEINTTRLMFKNVFFWCYTIIRAWTNIPR